MAEKIKVRPDCIYASNPFHECSEYCLRKTFESKLQKNKKNSGSFGFNISKSFGRKKKGSLPKPPISSFASSEVQSPTWHVSPKKTTESRNVGDYTSSPKPYIQVNGLKDPYSSEDRFASSEVQSPTWHVSPKKKTESRNVGDYTSSPKPYTKANGLKDPYLSEDRFESSTFTLPSEIIITPAYQKESSKTSLSAMEDKEDEKNIKKSPQAAQIPFADTIGENPIVSADGSSFSFSGIAQSYEEEDAEEVESVTSESCVSVGKYRVKSSFTSILQLLFDKYGDIAATCKLESVAMRSYYLECVCYIVQELQCTPFDQLSKSKIKELMAILKDVESSKINVGWLRAILNETAEAFELGNQHRPMEAAKVNCERDIESLQKDLEAQMEDLKIKEKEVSNAKARVEETKIRLIQLEQKSSQFNEIIRSIQSKIDSFLSRSLSSKLLQGL